MLGSASFTTRTIFDLRAEVGEDIRVGVGIRVGPMEYQLYPFSLPRAGKRHARGSSPTCPPTCPTPALFLARMSVTDARVYTRVRVLYTISYVRVGVGVGPVKFQLNRQHLSVVWASVGLHTTTAMAQDGSRIQYS